MLALVIIKVFTRAGNWNQLLLAYLPFVGLIQFFLSVT